MTLNPTVTWDNGTTSKVKQLSDHHVMRSVRRKIGNTTSAPLEDTSVRSKVEVYDEECARLKRERVLLNESCTLKSHIPFCETLSTVILRVGYFTGGYRECMMTTT